MLAALFSGPDSAHGMGHPVMAVGDPLQAIYEWRGAAASNILNFTGAFRIRKGRQPRCSLATNRRCADQIINAANVASEELRQTLSSAVESGDHDPADDRAEVAVGQPLVAPEGIDVARSRWPHILTGLRNVRRAPISWWKPRNVAPSHAGLMPQSLFDVIQTWPTSTTPYCS